MTLTIPNLADVRRWRPTAKHLVLVVVTIVIGYLVGAPLLYVLWGTFFNADGFTLSSFDRAFGDSEAFHLVFNSVTFALGAGLLALVVGTALAYLHARTDVPFKGLFFAASLIPIIIPPVVYAPAWVFLLSKDAGVVGSLLTRVFGGSSPIDIYGLPGMILVQGLHLAPIVFLFMAASFRSMDPSLEECARVCGARWSTVFKRVTMPLVRPAVAAAGVIVVVLGLESFEIPVMIGEPRGIYVFTSRIYFLTNGYPADLGAAGALSVSLMVVALALMVFGRVGSGGSPRDVQTVTGKGFRPAPVMLGRARPWAGALVVLFFLTTAIAPFAVLLYVSLSPFYTAPSWDSLSQLALTNYQKLAELPGLDDALLHTIVVAVVSATLVMVLTTVTAWFVARSKMRATRLLDFLALVPLVIPGVVLGLGLAFVYLRFPIAIYGTVVLLAIAYVTRFIPYGMRYAGAALAQIADELEEAALVGGATWWQSFRRIVLPLAAPGIVSGWIFVLMVSFRELSSTILLAGPDSEVLSVILFRQYNEGTFGIVAALGVLMVTLMLVLILAAYRFGSRFGIRLES